MSVFIRLVSEHGPAAVAAVGAGTRVEGFALIPVMALGAVLTPFIGQNWGARRRDRAVMAMQRAHQYAFAWGVFCLVAFIPLAGLIANVFAKEAEVHRAIRLYLWIVPIGYALQGSCQLASIAFNAVNKPLYSVALNSVRLFILFIPLAWLGGKVFDYKGLLGGVAAANICAGIFGLFWVYRVLGHHRDEKPNANTSATGAEQ
jgi:Na+-driven multidrug efflux pump